MSGAGAARVRGGRFLELLRRRRARDAGRPLAARLLADASFLSDVALARVHLRACDRVGPWVRTLGGTPRIENHGHIELGERTRLFSSFAPVELRALPGGTLLLGARVTVNFGTSLVASTRIHVGDGVSFGPWCIVSDAEGPSGEGAGPIEIGEGAWLASRVTVLPGARIGPGSVITAGSVVDGEIPPGVVAGGIPARVIRRLAEPETSDAVGPRAEGSPAADEPAPISETRPSNPRAAHTPPPQPAPREACTPGTRTVTDGALRGLLVGDFTLDELARCLEADPGAPGVAAEVAPFDQVVATLLGRPVADFAVVWTRPEATCPTFARRLAHEDGPEDALLAEVDAFADLLLAGTEGVRFTFVPSWTLPPSRRGLGLADLRPGGVAHALLRMNARLVTRLEESPRVFLLDAARWVAAAGGAAQGEKLWYLGKLPFAPRAVELAARDVKAALAAVTGRARKLCIVDLDDTLWGGVVGDVGWEGLRLGGHDAEGEAFVDFQRGLAALTRRGVLLGIVSKNDESVALEAIRRHPEMVLREAHFAAYRINWQDKARNVEELTRELNLGLSAVVFLDDNPFERARVREVLPEVLVPDWPEDRTLYPSALAALDCFDQPSLSAEDRTRTALYGAERERDALRAAVGSFDDWLRGLELVVRVDLLRPENLARAAQLLNKTNQLNLSTRRLGEAELAAWAAAPGNTLLVLSVSDRLGDSGLTGLLGLTEEGDSLRVVDFVLSCRVMGRRVEETMLALAADEARRRGARRVVADRLPTAKNGPCAAFFAGAGLESTGDHHEFAAAPGPPVPAVLRVERRDPAP